MRYVEKIEVGFTRDELSWLCRQANAECMTMERFIRSRVLSLDSKTSRETYKRRVERVTPIGLFMED
jgi:hypothetical protein